MQPDRCIVFLLQQEIFILHSFLPFFLGWLIPGLGHFCLEKKWKGILLFCLLFLSHTFGMILLHSEGYRQSFFWIQLCSGFFIVSSIVFQPFFPEMPHECFLFPIGYLYISVASLLNLFIILTLPFKEAENSL